MSFICKSGFLRRTEKLEGGRDGKGIRAKGKAVTPRGGARKQQLGLLCLLLTEAAVP